MKFTIACLIASFLLINCIGVSEGGCGCTKSTTTRCTKAPTKCPTRPPTQPPTRPPTQPPTRPPTPTPTKPWNRCQPCGPGGRACPGCPGQGPLCKDLLAQLEAIEKKIRVCVCGESRWLV
ncbi:salivary glue protein Sgs-3-like isoform X8 [Drosophila albomicans]|uniref:Salivary glue protein Sgs-3-like isoform X8 n=1 Tax=Drosophila albomicans TaxID=7291 RepID=A0A9C6T4K5_DROAB|nr:salivary glue protein Sgs-3-like isoform X8 [Drosophila albomicans]